MTIDGIAFGLAAQGVLVAAAVAVAMAALGRRPGAPRPAIAIIAVASALLPWGPTRSLAESLRGIWGDPSVVTVLVLLAWLLVPRLVPARPRGTAAVLGLAVLAGLLYLPVFGVPGSENGLYRLGWNSTWLVAGVASGGWTTILALALAAWSIGLHESDNLWDSLVDPGLLGFVVVTGAIDRLTASPRPSPSAA
jgi:hypothetical protein